ncbi:MULTISPECIES: hypothetical protein [Novosphingobium]|uniref:DUF4168 domain-containing protein n=1 Tax=Novosphingobium pentaromativorans TaxID=205844 RepID=A0A2W5R0Q4_9SPHN|nr:MULTISPECIES: hypothetical protein [Novosphingobium]PZQ57130.1 MAG: hypothetical protein DI555_03195 [Novosphingobium pentaromativorans]GFE74139.1 hypothetical protein NTCA1_17880 [Novosphingobium sp. TCA1]
MRKIARFIAPALVATLGLSAIAPGIAEAAAPHREAARITPNREARIRSDIAGLRSQIDRAAARRTISQREAKGLRNDAAQVQRLHTAYARGGLTAYEAQTLEGKVNRIRGALHLERNDRNGYRR